MSESNDVSMQDASEIATIKEGVSSSDRAPLKEERSPEAASSPSKSLSTGIAPPNKPSTVASQDIISMSKAKEMKKMSRIDRKLFVY